MIITLVKTRNWDDYYIEIGEIRVNRAFLKNNKHG
jgi:hypothetical protein